MALQDDLLKSLAPTLGSVAGGAIGSAIAPGVGTTIGSTLGGALGSAAVSGGGSSGGSSDGGGDSSSMMGGLLGAGQLALGAIKKRKAEGLRPPMEDVEQRQFLSELNRKRRAMMTGSAYQEGLRELRGQQLATQAGMVKAGGGAAGATIEGLAKAGAITAEGFGKLAAQEEAKSFAYTQLAGQMLGDIAERRYALQAHKFSTAEAEAAELTKAGMAGLLASSARKSEGGGTGQGFDFAKMFGGARKAQSGSIPIEQYMPLEVSPANAVPSDIAGGLPAPGAVAFEL